MRTWIEPSQTHLPEGLHHTIGGHPLVAQTLARRGLSALEAARAFLEASAYTPALPTELPGMGRAADRLEAAIRTGEGVLVWGDFDVDGQTATALLVSTLKELGARVEYHIPIRAVESHGVNLSTLRGLLEGSLGIKPGLILTCDTGISAHEAVSFAQEQGVEVVITDHHELPAELPKACAVVNPKLLPQSHSLAGLPGVGVAYKLAEELYRRAGRTAEVETNLDLVALGIVADVAPVVGDCRYLLQRGLELLRNPQRMGLQAIYERAELEATWLTEEHIGYVLAPRLNAMGRLSDANPAVELLTTQDRGRARILALQLEGLNSRRQLLTSQVLQGALAQIEQERSILESSVLVLSQSVTEKYVQSWDAGVIGIVASRLVELLGKPAVLITISKDGIGRGSARSVEEADGKCLVNIAQAIASQAELLSGFGGHAMAAGFSLPVEKIPEFRRGLMREVERMLEGRAPSTPTVTIDAYLDWGELSLELADQLERLAPFGPGNPSLVLASRNLHLVSHVELGREREHLLLNVEDETGLARRVIWWNGAGCMKADESPQGTFDLAYTLRGSTFRGQRDLQLEWVDFRPVESGVLPEATPLEVVDYRQHTNPIEALQALTNDASLFPLQVWVEGGRRETASLVSVNHRSRYEISPCKTLVIWTTPPGRAELEDVLERTQPLKVVLFGTDPGLDTPQAFLEQLAGMVKYAVSKEGGRLDLTRLTTALAQRETTVRKGLEWLEARGGLISDKSDPKRAQETLQELNELLEETRAYRAYFARVEKPVLRHN